ncbi:DUF4097 family beta strand repeat-containing protein [Nocardioides sp.]|uniref:DUF4097 family beta strand repeat-containing protein n=1 Tax=Nocardioides sp. TaxID=35761 RepID=UPI003D138D01
MNTAFETHEPVQLFVAIGRGSVTLSAADTTESTVHVTGEHSDDTTVELDGNQLRVLGPKHRTGFFGGEPHLDVTVVVPTHSELAVKTGSADIQASGAWGSSQIRSGSGTVQVDQIDAPALIETGSGSINAEQILGETRIKSGSGDVIVQRAGGACAVSTGSGDVKVTHSSGPLVVKTGSGDLRVATADGDVSMSTGSGDAVVDRLTRGNFTVKGASGDVAVGVPQGVPVWTDITSVSGQVHSNLVGAGTPTDGQEHIELRAKTVSGDVILKQL